MDEVPAESMSTSDGVTGTGGAGAGGAGAGGSGATATTDWALRGVADGQWVAIDPVTTDQQVLGTVGQLGFNMLAYSALSNIVYAAAINADGTNTEIHSIDPCDATVTSLGNLSVEGATTIHKFESIAFAPYPPEQLYASASINPMTSLSRTLLAVHPTTLQSSVQAALSNLAVEADADRMLFIGEQLFVVDKFTQANTAKAALYLVDLSTGDATDSHVFNAALSTFAYNPDSQITYAADWSAQSLYRLSIDDDTLQLVGSLKSNDGIVPITAVDTSRCP